MLDPLSTCMRCMSPLKANSRFCPHCGQNNEEARNPSHQLPAGSILAGCYFVGMSLGQGGFGITYVGWDLVLNQKVAIKEFYPDGFVTREMTSRSMVVPMQGDRGEFFLHGRQRFVDEARILARFSDDPCIVNVRRYFQENGTAYIAMDFIDGKTLKTVAREFGGRVPVNGVLTLLRPLMDSLSRVHDASLLHRDIAPDNIILQPDGSVKLLDFGAARQMSSMGEKSLTVNVKHGFAPEEQYRTHGEQGPWTDIYALCATIYYLTTGVLPPQAVDRGLGDTVLKPPTALGANFTPAQEAVILKGLSVRGRDRQRSMREFAASLDSACASQPEQQSPPKQQPRPEVKPLPDLQQQNKKARLAPLWVTFGVIALATVVVALAIPANKRARYNQAGNLYDSGQYVLAQEQYESLGEYLDAPALAKESAYLSAIALYRDGNYWEAEAIFSELPGYKDASDYEYRANRARTQYGFISYCLTPDFDGILADDDYAHQGEMVRINVKITQVFGEGAYYGIADTNGDYFYAEDEYYLTDGTKNGLTLSEGDKITVYGIVWGTGKKTLTRVASGEEHTQPSILIKYADDAPEPTPEPTEDPDPPRLGLVEETLTVNGLSIPVYAVYIGRLEGFDWDKMQTGESQEVDLPNNVRGYWEILKGYISNCYGIRISRTLFNPPVKGKPYSVAWRMYVRLRNGTISAGTMDNRTMIVPEAETEMFVLFDSPVNFDAIAFGPASVVNGDWSGGSNSYYPYTLYFATREDAQTYIDTLQLT